MNQQSQSQWSVEHLEFTLPLHRAVAGGLLIPLAKMRQEVCRRLAERVRREGRPASRPSLPFVAEIRRLRLKASHKSL